MIRFCNDFVYYSSAVSSSGTYTEIECKLPTYPRENEFIDILKDLTISREQLAYTSENLRIYKLLPPRSGFTSRVLSYDTLLKMLIRYENFDFSMKKMKLESEIDEIATFIYEFVLRLSDTTTSSLNREMLECITNNKKEITTTLRQSLIDKYRYLYSYESNERDLVEKCSSILLENTSFSSLPYLVMSQIVLEHTLFLDRVKISLLLGKKLGGG